MKLAEYDEANPDEPYEPCGVKFMTAEQAEKLNSKLNTTSYVKPDDDLPKPPTECNETCEWVPLLKLSVNQKLIFPVFFEASGVKVHQYYLSCKCV